MSKRQKRTVGAVIKVPVDNYSIHAQILEEMDIVFFDTKSQKNITAESAVDFPVLFRIPANSDAILNGKWLKIGNAIIKDEFTKPIPRFIQDALNPNKFQIYHTGKIFQSSKDECIGLECCAVWAVNHIEDRIRDYYNGIPNIWLEQLKIK